MLDHGGVQGWWSEKFYEEALLVAAANDNVYLETGIWWSELYHKALIDPNIGAEKLIWAPDRGHAVVMAWYGGDRNLIDGHLTTSYGRKVEVITKKFKRQRRQ